MFFRKFLFFLQLAIFFSLISAMPAIGQKPKGGGGPPPARKHTVTQSSELPLVPSNVRLREDNQVEIKIGRGKRRIVANGIPSHEVGVFPNCGNPHTISAQKYSYSVDFEPRWTGRRQSLRSGQSFGVAVNGVPFDPLAAEYYEGVRNSDWRYEALSGAVNLGVDQNHAHVQPSGAYHYHGLPWGLLNELRFNQSRHSPIIGWAADGYPIYALYGFVNRQNRNDGVKKLSSSYQLKQGKRPRDYPAPGGHYDGTFIVDYGFVKGSGDLDECNGLKTKTPDFPNGTYAYFLSETWPVVPRCHRGVADNSFDKRHNRRKGSISRERRRGPIPGCGSSREAHSRDGRGGKSGHRSGLRRAPPHIVKAARKLGISVEQLHHALGPPPPDFRQAARRLGMSVETLKKAMGPPPR